jgi:hypothetical protein
MEVDDNISLPLEMERELVSILEEQIKSLSDMDLLNVKELLARVSYAY